MVRASAVRRAQEEAIMNVVVDATGPVPEPEYWQEVDARGEAMLGCLEELDALVEACVGRLQADMLMGYVLDCMEQAWDLYVLAEAHAGYRLRNALQGCAEQRRRAGLWRACAAELFRRHFGQDMDTVLDIGCGDHATIQSPGGRTQTDLPGGRLDVDSLLREAAKGAND